MKQLYILTLGIALFGLVACSDSDDNQSSQPTATKGKYYGDLS